MRLRAALPLFLAAVQLPACAHPAPRVFSAQWWDRQELTSWHHLAANISPREPKVPGGPTPARGIVVAALSKKDPDYYFHWVRDSSHVMAVLARAFAAGRPYAERASIERQFAEFLNLSRRLQRSNSPWGLGEVRFTVTGAPDTLPWSRPQFDGPPLRALAVIDFLEAFKKESLPKPISDLALDVLKTDLVFTAAKYKSFGFDVWEELRAENYQTRLSQLAALEKGRRWLGPSRLNTRDLQMMAAASKDLSRLLDAHWDAKRNCYRSQLKIEATDGYSKKHTDLDSAVIVAVIDADLPDGRHSVLDPRVQATVLALENLFSAYPINRGASGLLYGRYEGDAYFGGNPWYLITAYYAQFYYRLAARIEAGESFRIDSDNEAFARNKLGSDLKTSTEANVTRLVDAKDIARKFKAEGDRIMERLAQATPSDGQLYEQIDQTTGAPKSSRGIGWAHAELLNAIFDRARAQPKN